MPDHLTQALTALADPTRRQVLEELARTPLAVGALAARFPVSRPAISQHLKVLSDAGLVSVTKQGTRNIYQAEIAGLQGPRHHLDTLWQDILTMQTMAAELDALSLN